MQTQTQKMSEKDKTGEKTIQKKSCKHMNSILFVLKSIFPESHNLSIAIMPLPIADMFEKNRCLRGLQYLRLGGWGKVGMIQNVTLAPVLERFQLNSAQWHTSGIVAPHTT